MIAYLYTYLRHRHTRCRDNYWEIRSWNSVWNLPPSSLATIIADEPFPESIPVVVYPNRSIILPNVLQPSMCIVISFSYYTEIGCRHTELVWCFELGEHFVFSDIKTINYSISMTAYGIRIAFVANNLSIWMSKLIFGKRIFSLWLNIICAMKYLIT